MRISRTQMGSLATSGGNVVGADGQKIGSIGQVYVDDSTGEPSFVTVKTGLFGTAESFVPLQDATVTGSDIRVAYNKTEVKDAPRVDPDERITPDGGAAAVRALRHLESSRTYLRDREDRTIGHR